MQQIFKIILLLLVSYYGSAIAASGKYQHMVLDSDNSIVSFATIKKQYAIEPATFNAISGSIDDNNIQVNIQVDSIDTVIPIRNDRLKKLFFQNNLFPSVKISANINKKLLRFKNIKKATISFKVEIFGNSKTIETEVLMVKAYGGKLIVTSTKPLIINANDFGIPADNLNKLAKTVGGIAISSKAPVNFVLVFNKKK